LTRDEALSVMQSDAGSALDPAIYRTFRRVVLGDFRAQAWVA
jgi:hypothetical protein